MNVYRWKPGSHVNVDAQLAGDELERIRVLNNGRLESEDVIEASRPDDAPLHSAFEWSDKAAAERWRVEQAKYLIRSIEVTIEQPQREPTITRAFVSVQRDQDISYTSTAHALSNAELRQQVLDRAWAELEAWRRRHAELIELAKVFAVIDQAREGP